MQAVSYPGVLGNLNITSIRGDLSGFLRERTFPRQVPPHPIPRPVCLADFFKFKLFWERSIYLLTEIMGGLSDPAAKSKRSPSPLLSALGAASGIDSNFVGMISGLGAQRSGRTQRELLAWCRIWLVVLV